MGAELDCHSFLVFPFVIFFFSYRIPSTLRFFLLYLYSGLFLFMLLCPDDGLFYRHPFSFSYLRFPRYIYSGYLNALSSNTTGSRFCFVFSLFFYE